jgi:hypothetical protein
VKLVLSVIALVLPHRDENATFYPDGGELSQGYGAVMIRPQSRDVDKRPYFDFDLRGVEGGQEKYHMLKDRVHGVREVSMHHVCRQSSTFPLVCANALALRFSYTHTHTLNTHIYTHSNMVVRR